MDLNENAAAHEVVMTGRAQMRVSGVSGVDCFNETMVVLDTAAGALTISGEGLNISSLDLQEGRVQVSGSVTALEYSDRPALRGGLLRRIFR